MNGMRRRFRLTGNQGVALAAILAVGACTDNTGPNLEASRRVVTPTGLVTANPPQIFVGAGDIATCGSNNDEATAKLVDTVAGTVFVLGDNAYEDGTASEFTNCYAPTWGRHKARTKPVPGNHDYNTPNATPYFDYFGAAAGTPGQGYYSFDLGAWHIIALNAEISVTASSAQMQWLRADLAAHQTLCTLAYWHQPLYSSTSGTGSGGVSIKAYRPLWDTLYAYGADLVLNGHRHFYERIAPIRPDGTQDPAFGIREIIVGSGGIGGGTISNLFPASEKQEGRTFGVLKLYLYDDSYAWKFIPVAGKTFTDSASTACHGAPASGSGTVSAARSTVSAAPTAIAASSGSSASTVTVTAKDANGTPVSGASVVLAATGAGNTVVQPAGATNASGVASGTLSSTAAGTKTVSATINGVGVTQTATVSVSAAAASDLAITTQPSSTVAGGTIAPAVAVEVRDAFGNKVAGATDAVTLAITTNPGGGTLGGTTTVPASGGVASFSTLSIDAPGTGYVLTASAAGLNSATSSAFDVTPAPPPVSPDQSAIDASPTTITAGGGASASTITVTARDAGGNPVSGVAVVLSATGSGNSLMQPAGPTNASGVATGTLSSSVAEPKTVSATAGGTLVTETASVTVVPPVGGSISHTLLTAGNDVNNQKVFTTASIAPAANALVTVAVVGHNATSAPASPTLSGGGMTAWAEVASVTLDSLSIPHKRMTIFRGLRAAPGSGPITITFPVTVSNAQWIVSQWTGVDASGTNGSGAVVQTASARNDGVNALTAALAPFGDPANVAYGVVGVNGSGLVVTPGGGFTEISEQSSGESPRSVLEAEWTTNDASIDASWGGALKAAILGVELKAAPGP